MPTLEWIGNDKVINHHLDVPYRVLERKYSYDEAGQHDEDNGSENMIIHGDNLDALKSLLPRYEGRVKCIYIDPPYNTGNEKWVYNDNVNDPRILKWLGQVVGTEGEDLSRHDKWLCMMYPRLKLLQRLLSDDGFIFISIDVFEYANLKCLMDEIFGLPNFRNCIAVRRGIKNVQAQFETVQALSLGHEYIYLYSKTPQAKLPKLSKDFEIEKAGKWDTFWRGTDRPTMRYEIFGFTPDSGQWRWEIGRAYKAKENYERYIADYSAEMSIDDYYIEHLMATNEKLDSKDDLRHICEHHAAEKYNIYADAILKRYIWIAKERFQFTEESLAFLVNDNGFIPSNRRRSFLKGLVAGFNLDLLYAIPVLMPQIENAVRELAMKCGAVVYKTNACGVEECLSMESVLNCSELQECMDENLLFNLKVFYTSTYGLGMRNQSGHGLESDSGLQSPAGLASWWFALHLCCIFSGEMSKRLLKQHENENSDSCNIS